MLQHWQSMSVEVTQVPKYRVSTQNQNCDDIEPILCLGTWDLCVISADIRVSVFLAAWRGCGVNTRKGMLEGIPKAVPAEFCVPAPTIHPHIGDLKKSGAPRYMQTYYDPYDSNLQQVPLIFGDSQQPCLLSTRERPNLKEPLQRGVLAWLKNP